MQKKIGFNKNTLVCIFCIALGSAVLTGCSGGKEPETRANPPADPQETSAAEDESSADTPSEVLASDDFETIIRQGDGSMVIVNADGSVITQTENGLEWSYLAGNVLLTFPKEWENRFVIHGPVVYSKECYDPETLSGELFRLDFCDAEGMVTGPKYDTLLGCFDGMYVAALMPDDPGYDTGNNALFAEYTDLKNQLNQVFLTARCADSEDFVPISMGNYVAATQEPSKLAGCWLSGAGADPTQGFSPYVVFRMRDSAFGYKYGANDLSFGAFLVNLKAKDYVWNTDNWGEAGLVFTDTGAYRVTYYETAPMTLKFEMIMGKDSESMLAGKQFSYDRDYQEIHQGGEDTPETELS